MARKLLILALVAVLLGVAHADQSQKKGAREALEKALNSIQTRIEQTETNDANRNAEVQANCTRDLAELDRRIAAKQDEIDAKQKQIDDTQAHIEYLEGEIQSREAQRDAHEASKAQKEQEIIDGDIQRAKEKELFENQTSDTEVALEAIDEVQKLIADSSLDENADDSADDFANHTLRKTDSSDYEAAGLSGGEFITVKTSHLLTKLAGKIADPNVQSFIQMAALSASALDKGDIAKLNQLLADLETELHNYKQELADAEAKAEADWKAKRAILVEEIDWLTSEIARLNGEIDDLNNQLEAARALKAQYEQEKADLEKEKRDLEAQKVALTQMCEDEQAEYEERAARRKEELNTLQRIRDVIERKLGTMSDRTKSGTHYEGEQGYNWVQGDWGACEDRIQQVNLYCEGPNGETVEELPELKCGPKPKGIRRSCRTAAGQDDYFF